MKIPEALTKILKGEGKYFMQLKDLILTKFGEKPAKMLIVTGALGWILSSLAQISVILFDKKIPSEQKKFLIPQEMWDALTNIVSFVTITQSVKYLASKSVLTGKLSKPFIRDFVKKSGKEAQMGKFDFDITKLDNFASIKDEFRKFKNGIDVPASILGGVISCNIVTPLIRNKIASSNQQQLIAYSKKRENNIYKSLTHSRTSMANYLSSSQGMKV